MKNIIALICLICICTEASPQMLMEYETARIKGTERGITFIVDDNLPEPGGRYQPYKTSGRKVAHALMRDYDAVNIDNSLVASSFNNDSMVVAGQDVLFRCIVDAYAEHRPLVLSPDMIWLNICQVFSHYVNEHAEKLRDSFVSHDGKISLIVETDKSLFMDDADWNAITEEFVKQIGENTKGGIAETVVADFSTTGGTERIASAITLMDITKSYFEYVVMWISCGIPEITLTGTPDDWRKVLAKTSRLDKYGMQWYTERIKPVLMEFIKSAEGKPSRKFWRDMVMLHRPDRLRGGACSPEMPTVFDGWFLCLFPYNSEGKRVDIVNNLTKMLPGMVKVPFRYIETGIAGDTQETAMELMAGFVGIDEDPITHSYEPRIGWLVRVADTEDDQVKDMIAHGKNGLELRVKRVPEVLSKIKSISSLTLIFTDDVIVPEWMDNIKIGHFVIRGRMSDKEKKQIKKRFPDVYIE